MIVRFVIYVESLKRNPTAGKLNTTNISAKDNKSSKSGFNLIENGTKSTNTSRFEEKLNETTVTQKGKDGAKENQKEKESITNLVNIDSVGDEPTKDDSNKKEPIKEPAKEDAKEPVKESAKEVVKEPINYAGVLIGNWIQFSE
jgi:hypothetical protein